MHTTKMHDCAHSSYRCSDLLFPLLLPASLLSSPRAVARVFWEWKPDYHGISDLVAYR